MTQSARRRRANRQKVSKKTPKKTTRKLSKKVPKKASKKVPKKASTKKESLCVMCGAPAHVGHSEESFVSLAALDPEAAVFYDRDLATLADVAGLCGPRFRQTPGQGLFAHYGSPQGERYVVYHWETEAKRWRDFGEKYQGRVIKDASDVLAGTIASLVAGMGRDA